MGLLILLQVGLDLGFIAVVALLLIERSKLRTSENPKLSRGLQLLSSKIAILQDLMDRSETMARQITQMIDRKQMDAQEKVEEIEIHLHKVRAAIEKSEEVAKIFQDKIPHKEIIERQNTIKYVHAAKLANQGVDILEIARQVDIPQGELELITKLNRNRLLQNEENVWQEMKVSEPETVITQGAPELPRAAPTHRNPTTQSGPLPKIIAHTIVKDEEEVRPVIFRKFEQSSSGKI